MIVVGRAEGAVGQQLTRNNITSCCWEVRTTTLTDWLSAFPFSQICPPSTTHSCAIHWIHVRDTESCGWWWWCIEAGLLSPLPCMLLGFLLGESRTKVSVGGQVGWKENSDSQRQHTLLTQTWSHLITTTFALLYECRHHLQTYPSRQKFRQRRPELITDLIHKRTSSH